MAAQMGGTIFLFCLTGHYLDGFFHTEKPFITLALTLTGTAASIYSVIRSLSKEK